VGAFGFVGKQRERSEMPAPETPARNRWLKRVVFVGLIAFLLTVLGYSQTLSHKLPSLRLTIAWFPLAILAQWLTGDEVLMVGFAMVQFPYFAFALLLGWRRFGFRKSMLVIGSVYILMTGILAYKFRHAL
jgi:hypothetical protein